MVSKSKKRLTDSLISVPQSTVAFKKAAVCYYGTPPHLLHAEVGVPVGDGAAVLVGERVQHGVVGVD